MTSFERIYVQTDAVPGDSIASKFAQTISAPAGVYESGLISILDEGLGAVILKDWRWYLGGDAIGLASTWQGNIFFWSPKYEASFYLDTQRGKTTFVDKSVDGLFNAFLIKDGVKKDVLFECIFSSIKARLGALKYCECYIEKPWQMLGGSGESDSFGKGDVEVYVSLTGQTIQQFMPKG